MFNEKWYRQKKGVPTGGSLCVQLANITVYYIMQKLIYSNTSMMNKIRSIKRYIDDGAGTYTGTTHQFKNWIVTVNEKLASIGLLIDEYTIKDPDEYVPFLDIQFCFDNNGTLQTDLYIKETDSRAYLNYFSSHANHTFSGIIFSQCIRLRRIINDDSRLSSRLDELKSSFLKAGYPKKMVENICNKVKNTPRSLEPKTKENTPQNSQTPKIRIISTYDSDAPIIETVKKFEPELKITKSFSHKDSNNSSQIAGSNQPKKCDKSLFQFVKKTGSSIRDRLVKVKNLAIGNRYGATLPCKEKNCMCCKMVSSDLTRTVNGKTVKSAPGTCSTYNIIYLITCKQCSKAYTGRSVRPLKTRIGEHRRAFYKICRGESYDENDDAFSPGAHLNEHNFNEYNDFGKFFDVCIIDNCNPNILEVKEHKFIHILNTLKPCGLNTQNPFGLEIL